MKFINWIKNLFRRQPDNTQVTVPPIVNPEIPTEREIENFGFVIRQTIMPLLLETCKKIEINKSKYEEVSAKTGVPWKVIAACHYRESSLSFTGCLHNGDPLNKVTVNVPKGRGPFSSWSESAIDAMNLEKSKFPKVWDLDGQLDFCEKYNGLGYRRKGIPSPYVWAGTNKYTSGLYVSDGRFDGSKVDKRLGCAAIIVSL